MIRAGLRLIILMAFVTVIVTACSGGGSGSSSGNNGTGTQTGLAIYEPTATPPAVLAGQQTTVNVSAYLSGASGSTVVQLYQSNGSSFTEIGNMSNDGTNVYSLSVPVNEAIANAVTFKIVASDSTTTTQDITVPVVHVPSYSSNSDLNQAASALYTETLATKSLFADFGNTHSPQDLSNLSSNLYDMFSKFEGITKQDIGFKLFNLANSGASCSNLVDIIKNQWEKNQPVDPSVTSLEQQVAANSGGAIVYSNFTDGSGEGYIYVLDHIETIQIPSTLGCQGGLNQEGKDIAVNEEVGQFFDLAGQGIDSLVGAAASGAVQTLWNVGNTINTFVGWYNDLSGNQHVIIGQAENNAIYNAPAGTYNLYASFGGSTALAVNKNVTISAGQTTTATFTPGSTIGGYTISGTVTSGGIGLPGVNVNLSGFEVASAITDSSGNFSFSNIANGSYTVTPSLSGFTFSPTSLSVAIYGANVTGENFSNGSGGASSTYKLPDTGQTACYTYSDAPGIINCAGTGQDGEYPINPMSFTDNSDGTITDNNTGLMWQKCSVGQNNDAACSGTATTGYNWYQAAGIYNATYNPSSTNVCGSLDLGGHTDWRLPNVSELMSIVDYGQYYPPEINATYFPNTATAAYYLSYTTYAGDPSEAWTMFFYQGFSSPGYSGSIHCVRGTTPATNFTDNGNGTVTDKTTGLMWQKCSAGQNNDAACSGTSSTFTWQQSLDYCDSLTLAGHSDWRLPNVKELESITDNMAYNPAIDTTAFPNTNASHYWASTTYLMGDWGYGGCGPGAWSVDFGNGVVGYPILNSYGYCNADNSKSNLYYVRCVR